MADLTVPWDATPAGDLGMRQYFTDDGGDNHPLWNMSEIATIKVLAMTSSTAYRAQLTLNEKDLVKSIAADTAFEDDYVKATFEFHNSYLHKLVEKVGIKIRGSYTRKLIQKSWYCFILPFRFHPCTFELRNASLFRKERIFQGIREGQASIWLKEDQLKGMSSWYPFADFREASAEDSSQIRHTLGITCYRSMNLPTYRSSYAVLWINGIYYGVYNILEDLNKDFLKSRFDNSEGNLYRAGTFPATLTYEGEDEPEYEWTVREHLINHGRYYKTLGCKYRDINDDDDDHDKEVDTVASTCLYEQSSGNGNWTDFVNLIKTVSLATGEDRLQQIDKVLSLETWSRVMAVEMAISNGDGYAGHGNNWFLYHRTQDSPMYLFPTDFSNEFDRFAIEYPIVPFDLNSPRQWSKHGPWNSLLYLQDDSTELLDLYLSHVHNFSARVFSSPALYSQLIALRRFLASLAQHDPFIVATGGFAHRNEEYEEILQVVSNRSALLLDPKQPLMQKTSRLKPILPTTLWVGTPILACIVAVAVLVMRVCRVKQSGDMQEEYEMQAINQPSLTDSTLLSDYDVTHAPTHQGDGN